MIRFCNCLFKRSGSVAGYLVFILSFGVFGWSSDAVSAPDSTQSAVSGGSVPSVVVSIAPLHALVTGVMAGLGQPALLIPSDSSPHGAALRPSQADTLSTADLVIWIGPELETRLGRPIAALADQARILRLRDDKNLDWLVARSAGHHHHHDHHDDDHGRDRDRDDDDRYDDDDHHGHERDDDDRYDDDNNHDHERDDDDRYDDDDDHGHDRDDDDHGRDRDDDDRYDEDDHHDHERDDDDQYDDDGDHDHHGRSSEGSTKASIGRIDPHLWLDPKRAAVFVEHVAGVLADMDPGHAAFYRGNAQMLAQALIALDAEIADALRPVARRGYVVAHDAYQYFENRYQLHPLGFVAVSPDRPPGAASMRALRNSIAASGPLCLFTETQFSPRVTGTLADEFGLQTARLDPLAPPTDLSQSGSDHRASDPVITASGNYFAMMRHLAVTMAGCLLSLPGHH